MRALTLLLVLALVPAALARPPKRPSAGKYSGKTEKHLDVLLLTDGTSLEIASFAFKCDGLVAHAGLNGVPIKKRKQRYRFKIAANASIGFDDDYALSENGTVRLSGTFSRSARRVTGTLVVRSSRCQTGTLQWVARRNRNE
jgi:hypothetical protein